MNEERARKVEKAMQREHRYLAMMYLKHQGWSWEDIALAFGITRQAAYQFARRYQARHPG